MYFHYPKSNPNQKHPEQKYILQKMDGNTKRKKYGKTHP